MDSSGEFWRALLVKYIDHVGACEGTSFLSDTYRDLFTDEEWEALKLAEVIADAQ